MFVRSSFHLIISFWNKFTFSIVYRFALSDKCFIIYQIEFYQLCFICHRLHTTCTSVLHNARLFIVNLARGERNEKKKKKQYLMMCSIARSSDKRNGLKYLKYGVHHDIFIIEFSLIQMQPTRIAHITLIVIQILEMIEKEWKLCSNK